MKSQILPAGGKEWEEEREREREREKRDSSLTSKGEKDFMILEIFENEEKGNTTQNMKHSQNTQEADRIRERQRM